MTKIKVVEILYHSEPRSGTTVFEDGAKAYWNWPLSKQFVFTAPWIKGIWCEFIDEPVSPHGKSMVLDEDESDAPQSTRKMTRGEEAEWNALRNLLNAPPNPTWPDPPMWSVRPSVIASGKE